MIALEEWHQHHSKINVFLGVTLGTGFGLGLVLNKKIFTGGNNMPMEYGLSPFKWGKCEKNISINYIKKYAKKLYMKDMSPREVEEKFYNNDKKAILIYNNFGKNVIFDSFNINNISIVQSKSKEISTLYGCCINVLNKK